MENREALIKRIEEMKDNSIMQYCVHHILQSGLLFPSHIRNVLLNWVSVYEQQINWSDEILRMTEDLSSSIQQELPPVVNTVSTSPTVILTMAETARAIREKPQKHNIRGLIEALQNFMNLYRMVIDYFNQQASIFGDGNMSYPYTEGQQELITLLCYEEVRLMKYLKVFVIDLINQLPILASNYNFVSYMEVSDLNLIQMYKYNLVEYLEERYMLLSYMVSIFSTCLAITLLRNINVDELLNNQVPRASESVLACNTNIETMLYHMRSNYSNNSIPKKETTKQSEDYSSKLQLRTDHEANATAVLEKTVYEEPPQHDQHSHAQREMLRQLGRVICEVGTQLFALFESLEMAHIMRSHTTMQQHFTSSLPVNPDGGSHTLDTDSDEYQDEMSAFHVDVASIALDLQADDDREFILTLLLLVGYMITVGAVNRNCAC